MNYPNRAIRRKHVREKHVTMAKVIKGVKHHVCTVPECSVEWADAPVEEME